MVPVERPEFEQFQRTYEVRHAELRLEIQSLENDIKGQMNTLNSKMDNLTNKVSNQSASIWRLTTTALLSLITGYVIDYIQHLFFH